jgi:arabinogalactan oligomer/maltooligosaccharide transport system permease protein
MSSISKPVSEVHPPPPRLQGWLARGGERLSGRSAAGRRLSPLRQLLLQLILAAVAFTVVFPLLWIVSISLDPRSISRPTTLTLIPPGASFDAYAAVIAQPTSNPVDFFTLAKNSLLLAGGTALASVLIGVSAAYAFSRFKFGARQLLMLLVLTVLMLPSIATLPALFVLLNKVRVDLGFLDAIGLDIASFNLRDSLPGVGFAMISGMLPFAIWNLKGYLDTIPKELEEAATIDGASTNQIFLMITLPLATPALAVTAFLGFMSGWTEFAISWQFLNDPKTFTLTMSLFNMIGQYADNTPWSKFAAMSILIALPVAIVYLALQKYIVSGLTIGSVKG